MASIIIHARRETGCQRVMLSPYILNDLQTISEPGKEDMFIIMYDLISPNPTSFGPWHRSWIFRFLFTLNRQMARSKSCRMLETQASSEVPRVLPRA
jgi:hypothetical protein